ncbi:hypothetical protein UA08_05091 [Talaromyces atroroseus]|uniref:Uncharacterized protein n=1 Tax=Talaromyces atroroseus TaxID=1441469 RepID=A0A225AJQ6_TALAT|nr:hypothetical protein UA08_05091 [Talaromyces atroroseus]OKL59603.1 hypothetical protein UA08_05091 [Talaromyces atroroseus]
MELSNVCITTSRVKPVVVVVVDIRNCSPGRPPSVKQIPAVSLHTRNILAFAAENPNLYGDVPFFPPQPRFPFYKLITTQLVTVTIYLVMTTTTLKTKRVPLEQIALTFGDTVEHQVSSNSTIEKASDEENLSEEREPF